MCGRYDLNITAMELAARFQAQVLKASTEVTPSLAVGWQPRYNIAPGQHNPVVVKDAGGHNELTLMQWGLVPAWSREARVGYSTINARAETVASKPAFRKPLATQRCLVPASGYFEWMAASEHQGTKGSQAKQPYRIQLQGDGEDRVFAFAGLYDTWRGPGGQELQTYAIVTTRANDALSPIHSRMPVILPGEAEEEWLYGNNDDIERLISLLQPYPEEEMAAYPVSRLVNSPMNDRRELIEPLRALAA